MSYFIIILSLHSVSINQRSITDRNNQISIRRRLVSTWPMKSHKFVLTRVCISAYVVLTYRFIIVSLRSISTSRHQYTNRGNRISIWRWNIRSRCSILAIHDESFWPKSHFSSGLQAACRDRSSPSQKLQQWRSHFRFCGNYAERPRPRSLLISAACHYRTSGHLFAQLIEFFIRPRNKKRCSCVGVRVMYSEGRTGEESQENKGKARLVTTRLRMFVHLWEIFRVRKFANSA